jgi:hypothetical protein
MVSALHGQKTRMLGIRLPPDLGNARETYHFVPRLCTARVNPSLSKLPSPWEPSTRSASLAPGARHVPARTACNHRPPKFIDLDLDRHPDRATIRGRLGAPTAHHAPLAIECRRTRPRETFAGAHHRPRRVARHRTRDRSRRRSDGRPGLTRVHHPAISLCGASAHRKRAGCQNHHQTTGKLHRSGGLRPAP